MVSVRPIQKSNDWMMKFEVLMMADIAVAVHVAEITMMRVKSVTWVNIQL